MNNLRCAEEPTLIAESKEELKNLLMKVKEESAKVGLRFNIQKTKIMAPRWSQHFMANRWGNSGNSDRLYFFGPPNHCRWVGDCSHEITRCLLLGRKAMINLTSVQFSCSVMSDSLRPHGLQQSRPPCPSPTPRAYPSSCPLLIKLI